METKELEKDNLKRTYEIKISAKEVAEKKSSKLLEIASKAKMQGFRPGKAPMKLVEAQYGSKIMSEVIDELANVAIDNLYKEHKLETISKPEISIVEFTEEKGMIMSVKTEVFPEIIEPDFSKIKLDKTIVEITDKEINESLEQIANHHKKHMELETKRAAQLGDMVVINFEGSIDGVLFDGGTAKDFSLELGSKMFIPGFEEQLVGVQIGDSLDVKVPFPKDYHAVALAGKDSVFKVEILNIKEAKAQEINDDLAKLVNLKTLEELKDNIREKYNAQTEQIEKGNLKKALVEHLKKIGDFELPNSLIKAETDLMWKEFEHFKTHMKSHEEKGDFDAHKHSDDEIEMYKKSDEEVQVIHLEKAKERIKLGLLLNSVAKNHALAVTKEDEQSMLELESMMYGTTKDQLKAYYQSNKDTHTAFENRLREDKIMTFILSKVNYNEKKVTFEEYTNSLKN